MTGALPIRIGREPHFLKYIFFQVLIIFILLVYTCGDANAATNVASSASVTVSTENVATGQLGVRAVDGVADGWPGDYTKEWSTTGQLSGAWITLEWSGFQDINQIRLYDRPNLTDQVLSGTLIFSDGSSVPVGTLPNNGTALTVNFPTRSVTWVSFNIDSAGGQNIGLAEIEVYGTGPNSQTVTTLPATIITTSSATLNGSVNPNGVSTMAWFEWGTLPDLATHSSTAIQNVGSGTTSQLINAPLAALTPWRNYYYRVVASNSSVTTRGSIRSFPTGEYYVAVGDSITRGSGDDYVADDTSLDGRNTGGGFEPILNNLLTAAKGYPQTVLNEGVSGYTSADGRGILSTMVAIHPDARYFLVLYGTNDAAFSVPSGVGLEAGNPGYAGSFKDNMQQIISTIVSSGKTPLLAKIPYSLNTTLNVSIQDYNLVVDELVAANGIPVSPPDLYNYFTEHQQQYSDQIHPNGAGYQSIADLWFNAITI